MILSWISLILAACRGCNLSADEEPTRPNTLIFMSLSVPTETWKDYSEEMGQDGVFLLRGVPNNSFTDYALKVAELRMAGVNAPIEINPELFTKHLVEVVPTIVMQEDRVEGNITLDAAKKLTDYLHETFKEAKEDREFQFPNLDVLPETAGVPFNPFKEACWSCLFPMRIAGVLKVSTFSDALHPFNVLKSGIGEEKPDGFWKAAFCKCKDAIGIKASFWEPAMFVEVTPTPYKILLFGGRDFSNPFSVKLRGGISQGDAGRTSFYHVHYIPFPILRIVQVLPGMTCLKKNSDMIPMVPWISEWDPTWRNPKLARVFSPDMYAHSNLISQNRCREDCKAANEGKLKGEDLWWCAGCLGSLYPFVGHVAHHIGGVQSSSLLVYRAIAKLHFFRSIFGYGTGFEENNYCEQTRFQHLQKSFYKTQLVYPIADKSKDEATEEYCHPLGQGVEKWGKEKTYPYGGEDFSYLVWTKMQCCIDLIDIAKSALGPAHTAIKITDAVKDIYEFVNAIDKNILENLSKNPEEGTLWQ